MYAGLLLLCLSASFAVTGQAQDTVKSWTTTDGRTRMFVFWSPTEFRQRRGQFTNYKVAQTDDGDTVVEFIVADNGRNSRGLYGTFSLSRNKILHASELDDDDGRFTQDVVNHIEDFARHKEIDWAYAFGDSYMDPQGEEASKSNKAYVIDLDYAGHYSCDPHAAAIYPRQQFNQHAFGRVFIRINKTPRISYSDTECEAWSGLQEQLLFIEAVAPEIFQIPNGGILMGDPNYPVLFVSRDAESILDISFCIATPDFLYVMMDAGQLASIVKSVESRYRQRTTSSPTGFYFYANTVQKNLDLMYAVIAEVGDC